MTEEMQAWLHRGEDLVDLRLPRVRSPAAGKGTERFRRLVTHEDVDATKSLRRLNFLAHEMTPFIREYSGFCRRFFWMRQRGRRCVVPRRREGAAESGDAEGDGRAKALRYVERYINRGAVWNVIEIRRQIAGRDRVEVIVVAVNPVDGDAERFVPSGIIGDVADAEPERNIGMPRDDAARGVERAVNVA
jgi:hypothetical protein